MLQEEREFQKIVLLDPRNTKARYPDFYTEAMENSLRFKNMTYRKNLTSSNV